MSMVKHFRILFQMGSLKDAVILYQDLGPFFKNTEICFILTGMNYYLYLYELSLIYVSSCYGIQGTVCY